MQGINHCVQETPHFRIYYTPGSFAEQHLAQVSGRLEHAYRLLTGLLHVDAGNASIITIYLYELLPTSEQLASHTSDDGPPAPLPANNEATASSMTSPVGKEAPPALTAGGPDGAVASSGYVLASAREIHEVYRPDAPGNDLEQLLLSVLLAIALGDQYSIPPLIKDGLLAYLNPSPDDQALGELVKAKAHHRLPSIVSLLPGPTPRTQEIYNTAAASFVSFLIHTYGENRFAQFVRQLQTDTVEDAVRRVYSRSLGQLEKAWRKTFKAVTAGGIIKFFKLSAPYLGIYRWQIVEIVIYLALSVAFTLGLARMQGILLDTALIPRDLHALLVIMGVLIGAFIFISLVLLRQTYLTAYVSESILRNMRRRMFSLVQYLHPGFFQTMQTGDILSRMTNDLDEIESAFNQTLTQGILMILTLVGAVVLIFILDWKLAILALVGMPLFLITGRYFGPATARASLECQQHLGEATSTLQENLGAQAIVKAFGLQKRVIDDYSRNLNALFRSSLRLTFLAGIFGISVNSIAYAIQLAILGVGGWFVIGGNLTVGTLFAFLALMGQIIGPVQSISNILEAIQSASGAMERVNELLKAEPTIADKPTAQKLERLSQAIRFENVDFSYAEDQEQPTLHNLNLEIPAGATVAVVGTSGSGKSTLLNLLLRFYDPQQGHVIFDSVDLQQAALDSLRGQMGIVFQDNILFNTSIRENIRLGHLEATDAEVEEAAKAAEIHELIMSMPQGYDTAVGERGDRLSGGQRQRIAIARAIIRNPSILLLDEATSALDPQTEAEINATLSRLAQRHTTVNVTHHLASTINADRIYVIDRGVLVEAGTHNELIERDGLYAKLCQEQSGASVEGQSMGAQV